MSDTLDIFIDLSQAGLDLDPEELEAYSQQLASELRDNLAEDARLTRASEIPEGGKPGIAGFIPEVLKAEVNFKNIGAVLNWLKERIAGSTLKLEYGDVKLEYRTPEQLEQQLQALEKISHLTIRVEKNETSKA